MKFDFDIAVIGGGLNGRIAALACADLGLRTALIDARELAATPEDGRASALGASSMRMLKRLGLELYADAQPIEDMLVMEGDAHSPWRLHFDSDDHGEPTGYILENRHLYEASFAQIKTQPSITIMDGSPLTDWAFGPDRVTLTLENGQSVSADLALACDGRNSPTRRAAKIPVNTKAYDQAALVTVIAHSLPHDGLAMQRFLPGGPLALLPLPASQDHPHRSQLVWSNKTEATEAAKALPEAAFLDLVQSQAGEHLGELSLAAPRQSYPLILQMAESFTGPRLALIGDAAHVVHPLAGQGLNLGLRDAAALADGLREAKANGQDLGVAGLQSYALWRGTDTRMMGLATDGLNGLFSQRLPLLGHIRRAGLALTNRVDIAKQAFMAEAAGETGNLPTLMQK